MSPFLLFLLILLPFLSGLGCFVLRAEQARRTIVLATGAVLTFAALTSLHQAPFTLSPASILGADIDTLILGADFILLFTFLLIGLRHRSIPIAVLAAAQIIVLGMLEHGLADHAQAVTPMFVADSLAMIMVLIVSLVGSAICIHAIPYMKQHEKHLGLARSRQPRFFLIMLMFLGVMNGLVLTNNLVHFYFFFEATTLCSYLLIGHDRTEEARKNALLALLLNSLGGLALILGALWLHAGLGTVNMQTIIAQSPGTAALLLPLALLCLAGFTKAAQLPFQGWLLGAMVAPTPTSALLHASTMVKAGVYLVLRFAPSFAGTFLSTSLALVGAFSFLAAAGLAVTQSNGKRILAYSTVGNLGLIMACAGINTSEAIAAALILTIFHAVSKALLFLCVGSIEQGIASRDIEDMRGLFASMPVTAVLTVLGVLTMILPPFGMLLGKWMAIESASGNLFTIVMVALGSSLTVVYWARWAGSMMSFPFQDTVSVEKQPRLTRWPLLGLSTAAVVLSFGAPLVYSSLIESALAAWGTLPYVMRFGTMSSPVGAFTVYPIFFVAGGGLLLALLSLNRSRGAARFVPPYLSGVQTGTIDIFTGPMNKPVSAVMGHYTLTTLVDEPRLTRWCNWAALMLLLLMVGGALP